MSKKRIISFALVLLGILFVVVAVRPLTAQAALPAGITLTPTAESPTNTPVAPTNTAPAPAPTETPGGGIVPPSGVTATPSVGPAPTQPPAPAPKEKTKVKATAAPILPTTGEIPPDLPFSGPFIFGILAAGILIGLAIGLGLRKLLRSGSWVSLFLSSRR